jgi:TetR/AcrR family transcriptional regulator, regulator of cefoperazone and chloramphenicol sensitivity
MHDKPDAGTRDRLLKAARTVFAERGVKEATVREICGRAGANIAAVNYYFGGKDKLFMAVLADYLLAAHERFPIGMGLPPGASAQERLKAYIRSLLYKFISDGDPVYERLGQLFTAEMIEPSENFETLADRFIMPQHDALLCIVRELMPGAEERTVHLSTVGVIGHCLLFDHFKEFIRRMCPEMSLETLGVEFVANFVFAFAMAGIERMKAFKE